MDDKDIKSYQKELLTQTKHEIVKTDFNSPFRFFYSNDKARSYVVPHLHDDMEIMYLLTGQLTLTVGIERILLNPGDIYIVNPNLIHSTLSQDTSTTAYVLQITHAFLKECFPDVNSMFFQIPTNEALQTSTSAKAVKALKEILSEFHMLYQNPPEFYELRLRGLLYEAAYLLFHDFACTQAQKKQTTEYKNYQRLSTVTTYMKEHYAQPITLNEIAGIASVTPTYFSRYFKQMMQMTFMDYITLIRLEHSYTDLLTTNYSVLYISEKNGFSNYQMFVQKFKKTYGMTPLSLRKSHT